MTDTTQERPASLLDDTGTIESFLACRRCAHNLRGQPSAGRCPQCGAAIGLSRAGDLLRYADPAWVDRMARGLRFVLLGLTLTVLWSALVALLTIHPLLGRPVLVVGGLLALHGVWLLTTSEPHSLDERRYARLRRTIRFALLIGLLNSPGSIVLPSDGLTPVVAICLAIVMFIGGAASQAIGLGVIITVLLFRPQGFFGREAG
ncbi:MAG: hypothetical protein KKB50_18520, partial [Planctomycetes bacterium]|nr:hypothetical protein [Planctomycetota bacterium]